MVPRIAHQSSSPPMKELLQRLQSGERRVAVSGWIPAARGSLCWEFAATLRSLLVITLEREDETGLLLDGWETERAGGGDSLIAESVAALPPAPRGIQKGEGVPPLRGDRERSDHQRGEAPHGKPSEARRGGGDATRNLTLMRWPLEGAVEQAAVLYRILTGECAGVVALPRALEVRVPDRETFARWITHAVPGGPPTDSDGRGLSREQWLDRLAGTGYRRTEFVTERGEFAVRGEVVDAWTPQETAPWRFVFEAETILERRGFDPASQRSYPASSRGELGLGRGRSRGDGRVRDGEMLPCGWPDSLGVAFGSSAWGEGSCWIAESTAPEAPAERGAVILLAPFPGPTTINFGCARLERFSGTLSAALGRVAAWAEAGLRVELVSPTRIMMERLVELVQEETPHLVSRVEFMVGPLTVGFLDHSAGRVLVTGEELVGTPAPPRRRSVPPVPGRAAADDPLLAWSQIQEGDFVVHERYGIGRYLGISRVPVMGRPADFLTLEYLGGDKLHVPLIDFNLVQRYVGPEGRSPRLHALDGAGWERVKMRVKARAAELAKELLRLYAARSQVNRPSYGAETVYEREFAASFLYDETPDQSRVVSEIMSDLSAPKPMDRLVCGDVGYGKTEVALRAAFKVTMEGNQVAVLVPTTLLAEQHYATFRDRFAGFPIRVEMLSRFRSPAEQRAVVREVAQGGVDIVIGTHRLLQKDVRFSRLGLVIIDEEHRFGVRHKEALKQIRRQVDALSLSATPIPRTLSMSLGGVRDMSVIETAPPGRLPIQTTVSPYDEEVVLSAIRDEIARGGQVFYVHNRIGTIQTRLDHLRRALPGIRFGMGHGGMSAAALEKTMVEFIRKKTDVLVATAIIESGLDIPNANTLIVENADEFGLAQLYQLRGRVGRYRYQAVCHLFHSRDGLMTAEARKRLQALAEFTDLGSGFRLALRDLEIRGAGNILGVEQHGPIREVGLDLYCSLLRQEVGRLKHGTVEEDIQPRLELAVEAQIPDTYVRHPGIRLSYYKRIASANRESDLLDLEQEFHDRFGRSPEPVQALLVVGKIRLLARRLKILSLSQKGGTIGCHFHPRTSARPELILRAAAAKVAVQFNSRDRYGVILTGFPGEEREFLAALARFFTRLTGCVS